MYPLLFKPVFKNYIWGGKNLKNYGKNIPNDKVTAESWEISTHPDGLCTIKNGIYSGKTLAALVLSNPVELMGSDIHKKAEFCFPLLVKLIDAEKDLSVQVHPEDEYAIKNENGDLGKNEMWYIIDAKKDAKLVYGLKENIDKEIFKDAIKNNTIGKCLNSISIKKGDILNIPAGLVHAIGKGTILAEIQQNSNTTYRLYDYDRRDNDGNARPLHLDKALDVINFDLNSSSLAKKGIKLSIGNLSTKTIFIANKYFIVELYDLKETIEENTLLEKFHIYIVTEGSGFVSGGGITEALSTGESVLIPAGTGKYSFSGEMKLLHAYVPKSKTEIFDSLTKNGFSNEDVVQNIQGL